MPTISKDQVKELLGTGLSVSVVASAVGCTDGYITQLLSDEAFSAEVSKLKILNLRSSAKRDDSINSIEDKILRRLTTAVEENGFYKPRDLLFAFQVVNRAVRRGPQESNGALAPNSTVINLNIPSSVAKRFTINQQGEVLQVDDQTLVTMPTGQLLNSLVSKQASENEKIENRIGMDEVEGSMKKEKPNYQQIRNRLLVDLREGKKENK